MAAVRWVTLKQPVQTRRHLLLAAMTVVAMIVAEMIVIAVAMIVVAMIVVAVAMIVVAMIVEDSKTASRRFS